MKRSRLLVPALVVASLMLGSPALAADLDPPEVGVAAVEVGVSPGEATEPERASEGFDPAAVPDADSDEAAVPDTDSDEAAVPDTDSDEAAAPEDGVPQESDDTGSQAAPDVVDDLVDPSPEPASPAPSAPPVPEAPAPTPAVGDYVEVTIAYTEIDAATGQVEIHGTGTPDATIQVTQSNWRRTDERVLTTVVALDGTWTIGAVDAFYGRNIKVTQTSLAFGRDGEGWTHINLSTDSTAEFNPTVLSVDYPTMTARVSGYTIPGATVFLEDPMGNILEETVADLFGHFDLWATGLVWEWNYFMVGREFQGKVTSASVSTRLVNPAYVPMTLAYDVVDAAAGTIVFHGTGTPGAGIFINSWSDQMGFYSSLVGYTFVDANGNWSYGPVNTNVTGLKFSVSQSLGYTPMDSMEVSVTFPTPTPPAPPVVAPVAAKVVPRPAGGQLAQTGSDSVTGALAMGGMLILGGIGALTARRRLTARR